MGVARSSPTGAGLVRDAVTWLVHGQLALFGYFLFGFEPVIPLLRSQFELSRAVAGLHGSALSLGSVIAGLTYPALCARFGRGVTGWIGLTGMCGGLIVLCTGRQLSSTLIGAALAGSFGALLVIGSAAILSDHHGPAGPAAITETNAVAAGAGLLGPALIGACVASGFGWRPALLLMLVPAAVFAAVAGRTRVPDGPVHLVVVDAAAAAAVDISVPPGRDAAGGIGRRFWLAWTVVVAIMGVEYSMTFWSADLLHVRLGMTPGTATAAVSAVVAGMFLGRMLGRTLTLRADLDALLLVAIGLATAGFAGLWFATTVPVAVGALALTGIGISMHYPLAVARAMGAAKGHANRAAGLVAIGAGCVGMLAPPALGAVSDRIGTHRAFLAVPLLLAIAVIGVCAARRIQPVSPHCPP